MDIQKIYQERFQFEREFLGTEKVINKIEPLVSVCVITYQHVKFIEECLESILMQKTSFPFEIIVGEDESTDGTRDICLSFAEKCPDKIRLFLRSRKTSQLLDENGKYVCRFNGKWTRESARGKYIALCEGDDYWTDPYKLQKQVDFLENHDDFVITYHNAMVIDAGGRVLKESKLPEELKRDFSQTELKKATSVLTLTMCFRNVVKEFPVEFSGVKNGDSFLISFLGNYGRGKYLENIEPAAYRIHEGGVWSNSTDLDKQLSQANTFYHLYQYYEKIRDKEISSYYKRKFKSKYKTSAIVAFKSENYFSALKSLQNIFRR